MSRLGLQGSVLVLLLAVVPCGRGQDATKTSADAPLDEARRELQELPAVGAAKTDRGDGLREISIPVTSFQPQTSPTSPSGVQRDAVQGSASSAGWLADGFNQSRDRDIAARLARANERVVPVAGQKGTTLNPLARQMDAWLTPETKTLLKRSALLGEDFDPARSAVLPGTGRSKPVMDAHPLVNGAPVARLVNAPAINPYLANEEATMQAGPASFDVPARPVYSARGDTLPAEPQATSLAAPLSPSLAYPGPQDKGRGSRSLEAELPPPTTPLIDEQRYFPQLSRF